MENKYIESFHDRFREKCLNEHWFPTVDGRETIEDWGSITTGSARTAPTAAENPISS
jgi:hypothetical protein